MSNTEDPKVVSLLGARNKDKDKDKQEQEATEEKSTVTCSFCGRPNTHVIKMIQGPGVNICSECTMIAVQYLILEDKLPSQEAQKILETFWTYSKR